ncbi:2684_t:CDS:2, partial [Ambispora gerdemannii]
MTCQILASDRPHSTAGALHTQQTPNNFVAQNQPATSWTMTCQILASDRSHSTAGASFVLNKAVVNYGKETKKICTKAPGKRMKGVTNWIWESARNNNTLPVYLKVKDTVCQLCYNGMIVQPSAAMKEHMKATFDNTLLELKITFDAQPKTDVVLKPEVMSFPEAIKVMTKILYYKREVIQKLPAFQDFGEFSSCLEAENGQLMTFFDELILSTNLSQKKPESHPKIISQLLFVCYLLCTSDSMINALSELGITSTTQTI